VTPGFPPAAVTATLVRRQVDDAILWHLVTQFRDRREEITKAFERAAGNIPATPPDLRLTSLSTMVNRLLDNKVMCDAAEKALVDAVEAAGRTTPRAIETLSPGATANTAPPRPGAPDPAARAAAARGRGLEVLGRMHAEQGNDDLAARELKEALELNPTLARAPITLAEIEAKRGNKPAALEMYLQAAVAGRMKLAEEETLRALYREIKGSDANLEADLDRIYDRKFPNPVKAEKYQPSGTATTRMVLVELFTGSACPPCVSADLALDALLERYPEDLIAPLAYHAHIPGPDPMVTAGGEGRRLYYAVTGVPTMNVDGALGRRGGGARENTPGTYTAYISSIDKALQKAPTAVVGVQATRAGTKINVTAKASGLPADAANLRLHIVLAERHLAFSGENGIRHHAMVVRGVVGDKGSGIEIRGSSDTTVDVTFDLAEIKADVEKTLADEIAKRRKTQTTAATPPDYRAEGRAMGDLKTDALVVVAFVQDGAKNVLQAARANVK
jgi:tetratricopeptide (TPR) repeat protein